MTATTVTVDSDEGRQENDGSVLDGVGGRRVPLRRSAAVVDLSAATARGGEKRKGGRMKRSFTSSSAPSTSSLSFQRPVQDSILHSIDVNGRAGRGKMKSAPTATATATAAKRSKPRTPYMHFCMARKAEVLTKMRDIEGVRDPHRTDVTRRLATLWRGSNSDARRFYEDASRREGECLSGLESGREAEKENGGGDVRAATITKNATTASPKKKSRGGRGSKGDRRRDRNADPTRPKQPMSAFLEYSRDRRASVVSENPSLTFSQLSRRMGDLWRAEPDHVKAPYQERYRGEWGLYRSYLMQWEGEREGKENRRPEEVKVKEEEDEKVRDNKEEGVSLHLLSSLSTLSTPLLGEELPQEEEGSNTKFVEFDADMTRKDAHGIGVGEVGGGAADDSSFGGISLTSGQNGGGADIDDFDVGSSGALPHILIEFDKNVIALMTDDKENANAVAAPCPPIDEDNDKVRREHGLDPWQWHWPNVRALAAVDSVSSCTIVDNSFDSCSFHQSDDAGSIPGGGSMTAFATESVSTADAAPFPIGPSHFRSSGIIGGTAPPSGSFLWGDLPPSPPRATEKDPLRSSLIAIATSTTVLAS